MVHRLNIDPYFWLVKHKIIPLNREMSEVIAEEVNKLLKVKYIKEVVYPKWLSNVVLVKKKKNLTKSGTRPERDILYSP